MSLSAREQQALDCIADGLARSEPELASQLATFTRLTSDQAMPVREKMGMVRRDAREAHSDPRHPRRDALCRRPRRPRPGGLWQLCRRLGLNRILVLLWLVANIALLAVALAMGDGGSPVACTRSGAPMCAVSAPARSSRPAPHRTAADPARLVPAVSRLPA